MGKEDAGELTVYHCIINQKALCGKALQKKNVMSSISTSSQLYKSKRFESPAV